jgi:multidrug efflux pump subunit AcrB
VPLSEIVTVESRLGFSSLRRENGQRMVTVSGEVGEDDAAAAAELTRLLETSILPGIAEAFGVDYEFGGLTAQERDFLGEALWGFVLCLVGIYLVLAWAFESWIRPVVVIAVIPFGMIGTIWGHWQWGLAMNLFTVVGVIGMSGIIINNAILLISTADGYGLRRATVPAVIASAGDRLRPIMLTTLTTVLGLGPLMFERSQQALFLKPTVITLVYGLGIGAVLVLLLVPALLVVQRDITLILHGWSRSLRVRRGRAPGLRPVALLASLAALAWLAATLAPWLSGTPGPAAWLAGALPWLGSGGALMAALFAGLALVLALGLAAGARVTRRPSLPAE